MKKCNAFVNDGKGMRRVKTNNQLVFYTDLDVDVTNEVVKGGESITKSDTKNIFSANWHLQGTAKKSFATNAALHGKKVYERNKRGRIKNVYRDDDKEIFINV